MVTFLYSCIGNHVHNERRMNQLAMILFERRIIYTSEDLFYPKHSVQLNNIAQWSIV